MSDAQVMLRLERGVLRELDLAIKESGFGTRNEWLREKVRQTLRERRARAMLKKLEVFHGGPPMSEEEIVEMVKTWRREERERGGGAT